MRTVIQVKPSKEERPIVFGFKESIDMLGEEIKKHLYIEFRLGRSSNGDRLPIREARNRLWEEHGLIPDMDRYVDVVGDAVREMISGNSQGREILFRTLTKEDFNFKTFFNDIRFPIYVVFSSKRDYKGGYNSARSGRTKRGGYIVVMDNLLLYGNETEELVEDSRILAAHEITHAYEDWKRREGRNVDSIGERSLKNGLFVATEKRKDWSLPPVERLIHDIYYLTDSTETNARIAQMKQEIIGKMDEVTDSQSAWKALSETESYRYMEELERIFPLFEEEDNEHPEGTPPTPMMIAAKTAFDKIRGNDSKRCTFHQVVDILKKRMERFRRRLVVQTSKIVHDLFSRRADLIMDNGPITGDVERLRREFKEIERLRKGE